MWHNATTELRGLPEQEQQVLTFSGRQLLDLFSPSNYILTNLEVLRATLEQGGANLLQGALNFIEDCERRGSRKRPIGADRHVVGGAVAITPRAKWSNASG